MLQQEALLLITNVLKPSKVLTNTTVFGHGHAGRKRTWHVSYTLHTLWPEVYNFVACDLIRTGSAEIVCI